MLKSYVVNEAGPSHIRLGVPCQDSYAVRAIRDGGGIVAAVADGLGSEMRSDVGSSIAANVAVESVADYLDGHVGEGGVDEAMRDAFGDAYDAVLSEASRRGEPAGEFDSTLCLAALVEGTLWWGHSGDSGLICAHADGTYELVTRMQRDDEGRVFPLCFSDHWEFGRVEDVSTFLLCTDGILGVLAPSALERVWDQPLDTRMARMFLHPQEGDGERIDELEADAGRYWAGYDPAILDDDKTMVVAFDADNPPADCDAPYYDGPDWDAVRRRIDTLLYGQPRQGVVCEGDDETQDPVEEHYAPPMPGACDCETHASGRRGATRDAATDQEASEDVATALVDAVARGALVTTDCLLSIAAVAVESADECLDRLCDMRRKRDRRPPRPW